MKVHPEYTPAMTGLSEGCMQLHEGFKDHPNLTKTEFAYDIGVSKQTLSHILTGRRQVTVEQAVAIEREAGIVVADWLEY